MQYNTIFALIGRGSNTRVFKSNLKFQWRINGISRHFTVKCVVLCKQISMEVTVLLVLHYLNNT